MGSVILNTLLIKRNSFMFVHGIVAFKRDIRVDFIVE